MNSSYDILRSDLERIGVRSGDVLVVHSSMKSMGHVDGGAECVIAALSDTLGDDGTLIFPTFTYRTSYEDSFYSNKDTCSCVGLLSEVFRKTDGVYRTNHPTHSVAIKGRLVDSLIEGEELDDTPMGIHSPYRKLASVKAKILMLGCPLTHNSYMHALEEDAQAVYSLRGHQKYTVVDAEGKTYTRFVRRHNFARPDGVLAQRYERAIDVLCAGEYTRGTVHGAESVLFDSVALKDKVLKKMNESPLYFVDDLGGFYPEYKKTNE